MCGKVLSLHCVTLSYLYTVRHCPISTQCHAVLPLHCVVLSFLYIV